MSRKNKRLITYQDKNKNEKEFRQARRKLREWMIWRGMEARRACQS